MDVRTRIILVVCVLLACTATGAGAQDLQAAAPIIQHRQPGPEAFEKIPPGKPIRLSVALAKTRSVDMRIRAFVVVDGRIMDVPLTNPTFNEADNLVFSAEVPAPLERMSYQFFVYGNDPGKVEASPRYILERSCIPIFAPNREPNTLPVEAGRDQGVGPLIAQNTDLEREIDLLNTSLNTLNKIQTRLK